ncbi:hypothetical protein FRACYDRAFT_218496 [Fragilariopsis cylindrus CCMP1102]|uniref:Uncharacterized protein n=1 Tax=Fragilariopsis cylindrus CCMP1102 TaxID=635003 RepID=A0A1E7F7T5_9STRA|nr:hypothetical protein FRACYDRAFT_218496 [Fragilariopsis cylindrus CCMP1102]|eukprot:OEU14199.1 hypothetical protein FRACYDRAFT_218496 [Fragilariopsis cylindrus CCMP1102]
MIINIAVAAAATATAFLAVDINSCVIPIITAITIDDVFFQLLWWDNQFDLLL